MASKGFVRAWMIMVMLIVIGASVGVVAWATQSLKFTKHNSAGVSTDQSFTKLPATQTYRLEVDGQEREFIVYRPDTLATDTDVPLIFMYHGGSGTGREFYQKSGWKEVADKVGAMAVFPTALKYHVYSDIPSETNPKPEADYYTRWSTYHIENSFHPDYPEQRPADDVAFTRDMVAFIQDRYAVDSKRIYASGFSSGGFMVNRLLAEASDVFAAYASSGSGMQPTDLQTAQEATPANYTPRPTIAMVGSDDAKGTDSLGVSAFPIDETFMNQDNPGRGRYVDGYLSMLGLSDTYEYSEQGKLAQFVFNSAAGRPKAPPVPFVFMVAEGMEHIFPNGKNYPVVAAQVYWEFFKQYSL